jgi:hypothetical protein
LKTEWYLKKGGGDNERVDLYDIIAPRNASGYVVLF